MKKTLLAGYELIDKDLGGLKSGEVTLIGGRPAMGKTSLALQIALNVARDGNKVCFFSAESSPVELEMRLISIISNIPYMKIRKWDLTDYEWGLFRKATEKFKDLPIRFLYADTLHTIKFWLNENEFSNPDLIIYDYLQLIHKKCGQTRDSLPYNTPIKFLNKFKKIAKKYKIPVIVLTQLSEKTEKSKNKRPKINDFRIKNLSDDSYDQAILLYREALYNPDASWDKAEFVGISKIKQIEVICEVLWNSEIGIFEG